MSKKSIKQNLALTALASAVMSVSSVASADLIISEYVEGSSYNKAVELLNSGSDPVHLQEYKLVKFANGDKDKEALFELPEHDLKAGETYLVVNSDSRVDQELVDKADVRNSVVNFNGDDPVQLIKFREGDEELKTEIVVDTFGIFAENGTPVKAFENNTWARRPGQLTGSGEAYNPDQWGTLGKDNFAGLGLSPADPASPDLPPPPVAYSCESDEIKQPYDIQGEGAQSPLVGENVVLQGIVTKLSPASDGFYLQAESGDNKDATSDGVFVYTKEAITAGVKEGSRVCVAGEVREFYNQTQVSVTDSKIDVVAENSGVAIVPEEMRFTSDTPLEDQLEKYEGMLVSTSGSNLVVTKNHNVDFDANYRNNMILSLDKPLFKPTQKHPALSQEAKQLAESNSKGHLFVDPMIDTKDGEVPYFDGFNAEDGYIRVGDKVENLDGVIAYNYREYRLIPSTGENLDKGDFDHASSLRKDAPDMEKGQNLRVASFNVLNYFNSSVGGDQNPLGQDRGAGDGGVSGNKTVAEAFALQRTKIINAMVAMDADIIGLMEIENNGFGEKSAIQDLVSGLNAEMAEGDEYEFVASPDASGIGSDAITVGMLYRPGKVALKDESEIIVMPRQTFTYQGKEDGSTTEKTQNKYQRNSLLQTFTVDVEGREQPYEFTAVVNHFKSKGSPCRNDYAEYVGFDNADDGIPLYNGRIGRDAKRVDSYEDDLQGSCNEFRVSAAEKLAEYIKDNNADENVLLLGDFNSYGQEDPIRLLTDYNGEEGRKIQTAPNTFIGDNELDGDTGRELTEGYGYTNLADYVAERDSKEEVFSYSYSGELGSLDHALASQSMIDENVIADVTDWHINSVENSWFEYSREYSGNTIEKSENVFSSSDHDPVVIDLNLGGEVQTPDLQPEPTPDPAEDGNRNSSGGGSFGFPMLGLGLLSLFSLRRKRKQH